MSEQLLTVLKFCLLALIYLFFFRVLRAVWAEITPPSVAGGSGRGRSAKSARLAGTAGQAGGAGATATIVRPPISAPSPSTTVTRPTRLVVIEPAEQSGTSYSLQKEISVGRSAASDITVDDSFVSQKHARVFRSGDTCLVEDLGSTNGTYLNQKKVTGSLVMQVGDRLKVGNTVLELQ